MSLFWILMSLLFTLIYIAMTAFLAFWWGSVILSKKTGLSRIMGGMSNRERWLLGAYSLLWFLNTFVLCYKSLI